MYKNHVTCPSYRSLRVENCFHKVCITVLQWIAFQYITSSFGLSLGQSGVLQIIFHFLGSFSSWKWSSGSKFCTTSLWIKRLHVRQYNGYIINGYRFKNESEDIKKWHKIVASCRQLQWNVIQTHEIKIQHKQKLIIMECYSWDACFINFCVI